MPGHLKLAPLCLALALPLAAAQDHREDHDHPGPGAVPLIQLMHNMQYYTHKLGLAIDAANPALQAFYLHEVGEVIEGVGTVPSHDGINIPPLLDTTLKPAFAAMEIALARGDNAVSSATYDQMLGACNACHRGAQRPYIQIRRSHENPYPQDFAPQPSGPR